MLLRDTQRILIDATNVNISIPGGGSFCTKAYIEALLALYPGRVDVMHPMEAHIRDERYTTIDVTGRNLAQQLSGFAQGFFHRGGRFIVDYLHTHAEHYGAVVISTGLYAGAILPRLSDLDITTIVLHHNYEPEYRLAARSVLTLGGCTAALVRYWERRGYHQADINLFLTQQDKDTFEQQYGSHPKAYVTGVFEHTCEHSVLPTGEACKSAVITCALSDRQNQAPLLRFAHHYLPLFHEIEPDWTIHLMGREPLPAITALAARYPYLILTANPVDLQTLAAESAIYLCPMDAGGGLKLRIMDGLRAGQPVLTHIRAARGYDALKDQPWFCTYHNADTFRQCLEHIVHYIYSTDYSRSKIQTQYYALFGLEAGIQRLRDVL